VQSADEQLKSDLEKAESELRAKSAELDQLRQELDSVRHDNEVCDSTRSGSAQKHWVTLSFDEWWGAGMVICLERGADLHIAQLMPLPLTVPCFSKIQIGFTFSVLVHPGSPGHWAIKQL